MKIRDFQNRSHTRARMGGLALLCAGLLTGCVERTVRIGSDPDGALVTLNGVEVGHTPLTLPFEWYGDYDIYLRLEKNVGTADKPEIKRYYLHTHKETKTPWFQWLGIDLAAELSPAHYKDEQVWGFAVPEVVEPTQAELLKRAADLKAEMDKGR